MAFKDVLAAPALYQAFQNAGGFFGARLKALAAYAPVNGGDVVVDIGCGPGYIRPHLPMDITYFGFDTDENYIRHARQKFGNSGVFECRIFDADVVDALPQADLVMMNGVIHHLDDETTDATLACIARALKPGGRLFTLDGCFRDGQSPISARLLRNDRGRYVRREDEYRKLLKRRFGDVEIHIREDLSLVPYTFAIAVAKLGDLNRSE